MTDTTPLTNSSFQLAVADYITFALYCLILWAIGLWAGKKRDKDSADYFLAGRTLPWYVIGTSFIAANISSEHFIGMVGATFIFGISVAMYEWGNINSFSVLIWLFIPFLLATRVFTIPEFLERRFNNTLRQFFAILTLISNITAFLAGVLYGGALALHTLFGWPLWAAVLALGAVSGSLAIYGGLRSIAWTDFFTIFIMVAGGLTVTFLGLHMLSGQEHSLLAGFRVMLEKNAAQDGLWAQAVAQNVHNFTAEDTYNRLSVIQPVSHKVVPWPSLLVGFLASGIWYSVLNQFMIQRVLGAKNMYHARMGIVLAGYLKILMPVLVVFPGLILFAKYPEMMLQPWDKIPATADQGYVFLLQTIVPAGLRGLFLAALFGAIQSTVNAVLTSSATVFTFDIYKRMLAPNSSEKQLVRVGIISSVLILLIALGIAIVLGLMGGGLFVYVQTLYAFFAPPFSAVFLMGILFKRINAKGAATAVFTGFAFGILMKLYLRFWPDLLGPAIFHAVAPFSNQSILHWGFCVIVCAAVSLCTQPPQPQQVTDQLTLNWRKLNIFAELGDRWYNSVITWWGLFAAGIIGLVVIFSGLFFRR